MKEMNECRSYNVIEANSLTSLKTFDPENEQSYVRKMLATDAGVPFIANLPHTAQSTNDRHTYLCKLYRVHTDGP